MPVTFDFNTNTLRIVGFTHDNPCTFETIYQANVDNGWNVVEKLTENSYLLKSKIIIGDNATSTFFYDTLKTVIFSNDVVLEYEDKIIEVLRYGSFVLGEGVEEERIGHKGCILVARDVQINSWSGFVIGQPQSQVALYGSVFVACPYNSLICDIELKSDVAKVWSCIISGGGTGIRPRPNLDVNDVLIEDCGYGISYGDQPLYSFTNIKIENCKCGVYWYSDLVYNLTNTDFWNNRYTILTINLKSVPRLIDCKADNWNIGWSGSYDDNVFIERAYTFKLKVIDKNNNPILGAVVEVYDNTDNLIFSQLTDSNGEILGDILVDLMYKPNGEIETKNPYRLRIIKEGYTTLETKLTVDKTMKNLVFSLDALDYTLDDIMNELQNHRNAVEPNIDEKISTRASQDTVILIKNQTDKLQFNADNDVKATLDGEVVNLSVSTETQIDNIENNTNEIKQTLNDDVVISLQRILGLSQENYILRPIEYNLSGQLTKARVKIYQNSTDCSNEENEIASYYIEAEYLEDGKLSKYKVIKE